jgi:hypothetical protein
LGTGWGCPGEMSGPSKPLGTSAGAFLELLTRLPLKPSPNILNPIAPSRAGAYPKDHLGDILGELPRTVLILIPVNRPSAVRWALPGGMMLTKTTGRPIGE